MVSVLFYTSVLASVTVTECWVHQLVKTRVLSGLLVLVDLAPT